MYQYKAVVLKIVDGDTVHLDVDLGFSVKRQDSFRLYGINAPEMSTPEGQLARTWLVEMLKNGIDKVETYKDQREKYGRYLGILWVNGINVNDAMVQAGHAVIYKP